MRVRSSLILASALTAVAAAPAPAAPPPNDTPAAPGVFEGYAAEGGPVGELQAVAELAEAQPDPGVPSCLGPSSFARTVWYVIPARDVPREFTVEATGRTTDPIDLAAFVANGPVLGTQMPNACSGVDAGGPATTEDAASAITLRVPAFHGILIQVGRRGVPQSPDDDRVILSLADIPLPPGVAPAGDRAGLATPRIPRDRGRTSVGLRGGTTTGEEPATPACPSYGGVWRRVVPRRSARLTFTVTGGHATSLAVFRGAKPLPDGFAGCVDREGPGPLMLPVRAEGGRSLWARIGMDRPDIGARATIHVRRSLRTDTESGGSCAGAQNPVVSGRLLGARTAAARNATRSLTFRFRVSRGPVCDARLTLTGPRGRVYARGRVAALRGRGQLVELPRVRRLARGRYRLRVEGAGLARVRTPVTSTVEFRLR